MLRKLLVAVVGFFICGGALAITSALENPQPDSTESGLGLISGWYCLTPAPTITFQIDDDPPRLAVYGSGRGDTTSSCNGFGATGFSYLYNYNTLVPGAHTIKVFADGVQFGTANFNTVTLGGEFLTGKAGQYFLYNFPDYGKRSRVTWQQSKQNFVISGSDTQVAPIDGRYFGAITSVNTGCTTATNNGNFVDFFSFTVTQTAQGVLSVAAANQALSCTYAGADFFTTNGGDIVVPAGDFSCTNGAHGTWASDRMVFDAVGLLVNMTTKYTVGETCATVSHIGGAR